MKIRVYNPVASSLRSSEKKVRPSRVESKKRYNRKERIPDHGKEN